MPGHVTQLIEADGWAMWPPVRYAYNTVDYSYEVTPSPPDGRHFLGTDGGGTDVFAKLLYGFQLSVLFGIALTMISSSIGVLVGALQGYLGGLVDLIGQRVVEQQFSFWVFALLFSRGLVRVVGFRWCCRERVGDIRAAERRCRRWRAGTGGRSSRGTPGIR